MAQLELFSIQSGAGDGNAAEPSLLALSDSASRQVPQRICGAHGQGPHASACRLRYEARDLGPCGFRRRSARDQRSEEHTSELQSLRHLVCRLLLEKKKQDTHNTNLL